MNLVFIHGRCQEGKDPARLKQIWVNTFAKGLEKAGLTFTGDVEIIFPFYGNLLKELVDQANLPSKEDVMARGVSSNRNATFFYEFLNEVSTNAGITDQEIAINSNIRVAEKGPLNWEWVQAILRTIDMKKGWGELALMAFTYDVFVYVTFPGVRARINEFVSQALNKDPCVVVGHSLGSIVGYNILCDQTNADVRKYVTLGSPLGLASIKNHLRSPLKMPRCVKNGWFNAYDDRDVVALNPLDNLHFPISPAIQNFAGVQNLTDNRHGIEGYLNDATVAKRIYDALE